MKQKSIYLVMVFLAALASCDTKAPQASKGPEPDSNATSGETMTPHEWFSRFHDDAGEYQEPGITFLTARRVDGLLIIDLVVRGSERQAKCFVQDIAQVVTLTPRHLMSIYHKGVPLDPKPHSRLPSESSSHAFVSYTYDKVLDTTDIVPLDDSSSLWMISVPLLIESKLVAGDSIAISFEHRLITDAKYCGLSVESSVNLDEVLVYDVVLQLE